MAPYPQHPLDPNDPDYDPKLDPHNSQYDPNDPRLIFHIPNVMSPEEADRYLASRRAKSGSAASPNMSTEEANQYLKQYRAQQKPTAAPREASLTGTPQQQAPLVTGKQPVVATSTASDIYRSLPDVVQKHPYLSALGGLAAGTLGGALLPEGAAGAVIGGIGRQVVAPVARWGLGLAGLDALSGGRLHETMVPKLVDLLTRGLEEGGGGSAP